MDTPITLTSAAPVGRPSLTRGIDFKDHGNVLGNGPRPRARSCPSPIPAVSNLLLGWFTWYSGRYVRRHFHSVRVSRLGLPPSSNLPLVFYSNHASWWDPLVGLVLKAEWFPERSLFTPIEAAMLQRYKMFGKLGFFGVEQRSRRGAVQFLRTAETILETPGHILAITPQSRFADVRERPVRFQAGLGHLAARAKRALFVPFVTEYVFWEERLPEILVRFGETASVGCGQNVASTPDEWTRLFEHRLEAAQDALARESQQRDPGAFKDLLRGGAGQGGIYDAWRRLQAKVSGKQFRKEHGDK